MKKLLSELYGYALILVVFASGVAIGKLLTPVVITIVNNWMGL